MMEIMKRKVGRPRKPKQELEIVYKPKELFELTVEFLETENYLTLAKVHNIIHHLLRESKLKNKEEDKKYVSPLL